MKEPDFWNNFEKRKNLEDSCCLKMHYKPTVGKTVWYLGEDRYTDQWKRKQTAEILARYPGISGKRIDFRQRPRTNWRSYAEAKDTKTPQSRPHTTYKNELHLNYRPCVHVYWGVHVWLCARVGVYVCELLCSVHGTCTCVSVGCGCIYMHVCISMYGSLHNCVSVCLCVCVCAC